MLSMKDWSLSSLQVGGANPEEILYFKVSYLGSLDQRIKTAFAILARGRHGCCYACLRGTSAQNHFSLGRKPEGREGLFSLSFASSTTLFCLVSAFPKSPLRYTNPFM